MWPLLSGLIAVLVAAVIRRNTGQIATAAVLLVDWIVNTAFCTATGIDDPWMWFLVTDYLSGLVLSLGTRDRWRRTIIVSYAIQCVTHGAYGYVGPIAKQMYWDTLYVIAWLQIVTVAAWIGYDYIGASSRVPSVDEVKP